MKIGSIVIHCCDFDRTVAFWQAALHYVPREPAKDGWVVISAAGREMAARRHEHRQSRRTATTT